MSRAAATRVTSFADRLRFVVPRALLALGVITTAELLFATAGLDPLSIEKSLVGTVLGADDFFKRPVPPGTTRKRTSGEPRERKVPGSTVPLPIAPGRTPATGDGAAKRRSAPANAGTKGLPVTTKKQSAPAASLGQALSLAWVPRDADAVVALRPANLIERAELASLAQMVREPGGLQQQLGVDIEQIEQATIVGHGGSPPRRSLILQLKTTADARAVFEGLFPEADERYIKGHKCRTRLEGRLGCILKTNARIVVMSDDEPTIQKVFAAGKPGAIAADWAAAWIASGKSDVAAFARSELIRANLTSALEQANAGDARTLLPYAPLWQNSTSAIVGLTIDGALRVRGTLLCSTEDKAKRAASTLTASAVLARNSLEPLRDGLGKQQDESAGNLLRAFSAIDRLLATMKVDVQQSNVEVSFTGTSGDLAGLMGFSPSGISESRATVQRKSSGINLRILALGLLNYHDTYSHFPPTLQYGIPGRIESKYPHSWRVAILPFIEQTKLYNEYKLDEPWDSPGNKLVLEKMPSVFRRLGEPETTTHTAYFGLVGDGTAFPGNNASTSVREFKDGLSKAILVVEARRDIPWTKPEDIPYDAGKPFPKLGGFEQQGFLAVLADAALIQISTEFDELVLRNLITISDGAELPPGIIRPPTK